MAGGNIAGKLGKIGIHNVYERPLSAVFLDNYLRKTGTPLYVDLASYYKHDAGAKMSIDQMINSAIEFVEKNVADTRPQRIVTNKGQAVVSSKPDYATSLGRCYAYLTGEASREGDTYKMRVKILIHDTYGFEKENKQGGLVWDYEMRWLEALGLAKRFDVWGANEFTISWKKGQTIGNGIELNLRTPLF